MAEKRMLAKVISISEKVNMLPDVFDMLLFTWMLPHTDDFGRLPGSAPKVKALVVPMMNKSIQDVEKSLVTLDAAGLIIRYDANGEQVVQIEDFEKHQQGLHKRTRSKFPDPPTRNHEVPGISGKFREIPSELKRTEENRTEENRTEQEQKDTGSGGREYRIFEQEGFGTISSIIADQINDLVNEYGIRWYEEAMKIAVISGKRTLSYVNGILKRWKATGIDEPWKEDKGNGRRDAGNRRGAQGVAAEDRESPYAFLDKNRDDWSMPEHDPTIL